MATLSRIALITGANRLDSIGYAAARQLALKHNFTIILGSRTLSASVYDAVKQLEGDGAKQGVYPLQINIVDDSSIKQAAKEVEEKFGRLDVRLLSLGCMCIVVTEVNGTTLRRSWSTVPLWVYLTIAPR